MNRPLALCAFLLVGCALDTGLVVPLDELLTYDRREWKHWTDADGDCQDARQEILIAASTIDPIYKTERKCKVSAGQWTDPYTGMGIQIASQIDIDHVVALRNAHDSGAAEWDLNTKSQFANDPANLMLSSRYANRSKGSRGPNEWLPPLAAYRCAYIRKWVAIKIEWNLTTTKCEQNHVDHMLKMCAEGQIPPLPQ
jgi:hypothetical protein